MNIKMEHVLIVLLLLAVLAVATGYVTYQNGTVKFNTIPETSTPGNLYPTPTQTQTPTPTTTTEPDAQLYLEVTDGIAYTDVSTSCYVDVCRSTGGIFNFLVPFDSKSQSSNPQAMNSMVHDGSEIVVHVASQATPTNGNGYYDGWYYTVVHSGNPIYAMDIGDFQTIGTSPSYTYSVSQTALGNDQIIGYVSYTAGTTPYWNLGKLYITPRLSALSAHISISYQNTALASVSDGATWMNYTTTKDTANATLASRNENIQFNLNANASSLGYGFPEIVVGSNGYVSCDYAYIVMTTSCLGLSVPTGWSPLQDTTLYAEKGFYIQIGPYFAPKGQETTFSLNIPLNTQNAQGSTKYRFEFWVIDCQNPTALSMGTMSSAMPTAYGFLTQYGTTTPVMNYEYTTSSGSSAQFQLYTYLTTSS